MFHSKRPPSTLRSEKSTEKAELVIEGAAKSEDVASVGGDEAEDAEDDEDDDDLIIVASSDEEGDGEWINAQSEAEMYRNVRSGVAFKFD